MDRLTPAMSSGSLLASSDRPSNLLPMEKALLLGMPFQGACHVPSHQEMLIENSMLREEIILAPEPSQIFFLCHDLWRRRMGGFAALAELVAPPKSDPNCASAAPAFCVILELLIRPRLIDLHSREESLDEPARPLLLLSDCCHDVFFNPLDVRE